MKKDLVSIIVPVYNAEKFIIDTLNTVVDQTYSNWELILVDDISTDNSAALIKEFIKSNPHLNIKYIKLRKKGMAAGARNKGIEQASGRYICYLDADDIWEKEKIAKQVEFMQEKQCAFSFTDYEFADETGKSLKIRANIPQSLNYKQALKNTTIWTTTVMFDTTKIDKKDILMPNVKSEDTASWWKILKKGYIAYGLQDVLAYYRRSGNTLSANKFEAIKRIWNLYRNVENLNIFVSFYNFCFYALNAVKRRI